MGFHKQTLAFPLGPMLNRQKGWNIPSDLLCATLPPSSQQPFMPRSSHSASPTKPGETSYRESPEHCMEVCHRPCFRSPLEKGLRMSSSMTGACLTQHMPHRRWDNNPAVTGHFPPSWNKRTTQKGLVSKSKNEWCFGNPSVNPQ